MSRYRIATDYDRTTAKRDHLTVRSGPFADSFDGWAVSLAGGDGYMVTPRWDHPGKVRVTCPTSRTDDKFRQVDAAIDAALSAAWGDP